MISVPRDLGSTGRVYTPACRVQTLCLLSHRVYQGESSGVATLILTCRAAWDPRRSAGPGPGSPLPVGQD